MEEESRVRWPGSDPEPPVRPGPTPRSDLHPPAVHLDHLRPQRLDGGQDQLLVVQGGDAQAQHVSAETQTLRSCGLRRAISDKIKTITHQAATSM